MEKLQQSMAESIEKPTNKANFKISKNYGKNTRTLRKEIIRIVHNINGGL